MFGSDKIAQNEKTLKNSPKLNEKPLPDKIPKPTAKVAKKGKNER